MDDLLSITGIGSLPQVSPEARLEFLYEFAPEFPFLPQFPLGGRFSQMILEPFAFAEHLFESEGRATIKKGMLEELLQATTGLPAVREGFPDLLLACVRQNPQRAKTQIIGPYTLGTQMFYAGSTLLDSELGRKLISTRLVDILRAESAALKEKVKQVYLIFDEPGLAFQKKKDVLVATKIAKQIREQLADLGAKIGLHSCAPLPGEPSAALFRELKLDVLSLAFPIDKPLAYTVSPEFLAEFINDGGEVIWGVVPTTGRVPTAEQVLRWWNQEIRTLAIDKGLLYRQSMLSPACGLGLVSETRAREVSLLLREIRTKLLNE